MAPKPNIDEKGAKLRIRLGVAACLIAVFLLGIGLLSLVGAGLTVLVIVFGVLLLALGLFGIYEGRTKWCAVKSFMADTSNVAGKAVDKLGEAAEAAEDATVKAAKSSVKAVKASVSGAKTKAKTSARSAKASAKSAKSTVKAGKGK